jgi:hypothetical protein
MNETKQKTEAVSAFSDPSSMVVKLFSLSLKLLNFTSQGSSSYPAVQHRVDTMGRKDLQLGLLVEYE